MYSGLDDCYKLVNFGKSLQIKVKIIIISTRMLKDTLILPLLPPAKKEQLMSLIGYYIFLNF